MEYNMTTSDDDVSSFGIDSKSIFGFVLTTYRNSPPITFLDNGIDSTTTPYDGDLVGFEADATDNYNLYYFPYECIIAGIAVAFFRMTIKSNKEEPLLLRIFFALALGCLAYLKKPYEMIHAIELFSYAVPHVLITANVQSLLQRGSSSLFFVSSSKEESSASVSSTVSEKANGSSSKDEDNKPGSSTGNTSPSAFQMILIRLCLIACSAVISLIVSHVVHSDSFIPMIQKYVPSFIQNGILYMIPIIEMQQAYDTIGIFVDRMILRKQFAALLFVTFHIQCAMGYLGIDFLIKEQKRRNELIRLDDIRDNTNEANNNDENDNDEHDENVASLPEKKNSKSNGTKKNKNSNHNMPKKQDVEEKEDSAEEGDLTSSSSSTTKKKKKINKKKLVAAKKFQKGATPFILFTAIPYMFQIITFGNVNFFAYHCFEHDIKRSVRLNYLFAHDSHLVTLSKDTTTYGSPNDYDDAIKTVVSTTYDLFNRKLFSLPKLLLLPSIMMRQPMLVVQITPFIFGSDYIKAKFMAYLTTTIEKLNSEKIDLLAIRTKVEAYDLKNAELLQRSGIGSTQFTHHTWSQMTVAIHQHTFMADFLSRTKAFFNWIQHHFVFSVMIDCALAQLIAVGKIEASDIFVFSRAIEDAVDTVLMRSRAESELAHMTSQMKRLQKLNDLWKGSRDSRNLLPCRVAPTLPYSSSSDSAAISTESMGSNDAPVTSPGIVLKNLHYSRGSAVVDVDHVDIKPGIYALTGANGSGKSTLFRILMSCNTNEQSTDLPPSIVFSSPALPIVEDDDPEDSCAEIDKIATSGDDEVIDGGCDGSHEHHPKLEIVMPSSDVHEISQSFYWPLYSRPIDWIYQQHLDDPEDANSKARFIAELLQDLNFRQISVEMPSDGKESPSAPEVEGVDATDTTAEMTCLPVDTVMAELLEEKEDWFNELSGGQKSKVELVRKVFSHERCPSVLLLDEVFAPLDPISKQTVFSKLKAFCGGHSVVIVIYHTDATATSGDQDNDDKENHECVPGNNFFDGNLHLESRAIKNRPLC